MTLNGVSFNCDLSNRMLAIVGPVGAGKVCVCVCVHACMRACVHACV